MVADSEPALPVVEPTSSEHATESPPDSQHKVKPSTWQRLRAHYGTEIATAHTDIPIIACCFVSGLCDSSAYNAWTCFVSMQTGNTIFLALGASSQPLTHPYGWFKSFLSILCFLIGSFCFSRLRFIGMRRGLFTLSFFLQGVCLIVAAALVQADVVPRPHGIATGEGDMDFTELLPLAFLALQSGGQMVASRLLGINEVPTTVLTSVYCDLVSDSAILAPLSQNPKRNRRILAILCVLCGAISGGWLSRSSVGLSLSFWIAAFIKMTIAVAFTAWKGKAAA